MKKLEKLLLINWMGYVHQTLAFENTNFITGNTGSGKSTIIDALQLVLLGDTTGSFFNKAANQKSDRTLLGYLYGELGDDGDTGFKYMRSGTFSSYVVLEFVDTDSETNFTLGFMADCHDMRLEPLWFILPDNGIPVDGFVSDSVPLDREKLKMRYRKDEALFFTTNKEFRNNSRIILGSINEDYRTLLKRAVSLDMFSGKSNDITTFLTESLFKNDSSPVNIDSMKNDIREYTLLEIEAEVMKRKLEKLVRIKEFDEMYRKACEDEMRYHFLLEYADYEKEAEHRKELEGRLEESNRVLKELSDRLNEEKEKKEQVDKSLSALKKEFYQSDEQKKKEKLEGEITSLSVKISKIKENAKESSVRIQQAGVLLRRKYEMLNRVDEFEESSYERLFSFLADFSLSDISQLLEIDSYKAIESLDASFGRFTIEKDNLLKNLYEERSVVRSKLARLEKGIRPYPEEVEAFLSSFEKLYYRRPEALCEKIELVDESFRNEMEAFLGDERFLLLFDDKDYENARELAIKEFEGRAIRLRNLDVEDASSSSLYSDYLKCEDNRIAPVLSELFRRISKDSFFGKVFCQGREGLISYAEEDFSTPFIGRASISLQIEKIKKDLEELGEKIFCLERMKKEYDELNIQPAISSYELSMHIAALRSYLELDALEVKLDRLNAEMDSIDMLYLENLEKKIRDQEENLRALDSHIIELSDKKGSLGANMNNLKVLLPETMNKIEEVLSRIEREFPSIWIEKEGRPFYEDVKTQKDSEKSIQERYYPMLEKARKTKEKRRNERNTSRQEYNSLYHSPFDSICEDNKEYDEEYENLRQIRIPEYLEKIKNAKERAYSVFKEDFISKIKERIESVEGQVRQLNSALAQSVFGSDSYKFEVKPNRNYNVYYNMFMDPLLLSGEASLLQGAFEEKYKVEIDELFAILVPCEEKKNSEENERNIALYTDYRTYLTFDLIVRSSSGEEQRLSRTWRKKSGGETQLPFYIAVLASFAQVCRIRNKRDNNTIRLIILDEAFSKIDGVRIHESIELLKRFGLQSVISAPPQKIADIAPLADKTMITYKDGWYSFVRDYAPRKGEKDE